MLKELLIEIKNSDYISKPKIAEKLEVSQELIEEGFQQLVRMGYIKEDDNISYCDSGCNNCPYASACNKTPVNTIMITEKGKKLLTK